MASEEKGDETAKTKKLAEFRAVLEKRIADAEANLESLKILLEFVDKTLLKEGFKRAEIPKREPSEEHLQPAIRRETALPLKSVTGDHLADLFISQDSMRVAITEDTTFNVETPPFRQFLVERVLNKMQEKDSEAASRGSITPDKTFSYELILDNDVIREIIINHVTPERMRELKSSIRWTLEKMYEKTRENR